MRILAIETSCDETGAAVVEKKESEQFVRVLSNVTATSSDLHAKTGGIIPEAAAREQVKAIIPVIVRALNESRSMNYESWESARKIFIRDIDAIAVTHGPGLMGSLLVGVETAKTLSFVFQKPIVPVHHLLAHLFANFIHNTKYLILNTENAFPFVGLIVSGGHTDLLLFESISKFRWLGGTRDDAAGEALDKIGRLLEFSYPAGPEIERRASKAKKTNIKFQSPLLNSEDFDFSFSGLKTEVARFVQAQEHLRGDRMGSSDGGPTEKMKDEVCYAVQNAIFSVLIKKTIRASKLYKVNNILLGGGVSANRTLQQQFEQSIINNKLSMQILSPAKEFATDNAAMIGAHALLNYKPISWQKVTAEPELYFD